MPIDRTDVPYAPLKISLLENFVRLVLESHCIPPRQLEDLARALGIRPQDVEPARVITRRGSGSSRRRAGRTGARRPVRRSRFPLSSL
jgi:hypothetical protein